MAKAGEIRSLILEYVQKDGGIVSRNEIHDHVRTHIPDVAAIAISQTMTWMLRDQLLEKTAHGFRIMEKNVDERQVQANPDGDVVEIAPFFRGSKGKTVSMQQSPMIFENVINVFMTKNGVSFRYPINGKMRIDLGPNIPEWSQDQVTEYGISSIALVRKDGSRQEIPVDKNNPITLDVSL